MPLSHEEIAAFVKSRPLFKGIEEDKIDKIAKRMEVEHAPSGDVLFLHQDIGRKFYIIHSGKVRIWRVEEGEEVELAIMGPGDEFGEESLVFDRRRSATVTTIEDCEFLTLSKYNFKWMLDTYPEIKVNVRSLAESHQQARRLRFEWLHDGELIYLITRRHGAELWKDMAKPAFGILLTLIFFGIFSLLFNSLGGSRMVIAVISGIMLGLNLLWLGWEAIDWSNDYFIITNQRVVWLEVVLFQSSSRQEAPMEAIQFVSSEQSYWGRVFDFGNVFIRTFTGGGGLNLSYVKNPKQFRDIIDEQLLKVRSSTDDTEEIVLRQSVRRSLGLEVEEEVELPPPAPDPDPEMRGFKMAHTREVSGGDIIYHKHVLVLLRKIGPPGLSLTALTLFSAFILWKGFLSFLAVAALFIVISSVFFAWLWYQWSDYKNDLYKVTKETVVDSEKKPFGKEETQSAPLKNIQSVKVSRTGLLQIILNYGDVNINVADQVLDFLNVHDPAQVQRDIFYRKTQLEEAEKREEEQRERERIGNYLRAYHDVWQEELEKREEQEADTTTDD